MGKIQDLTGQVFGRLTVLRLCEKKHQTPNGTIFCIWLCQCSCGNTAEIGSIHLKSGDTKSCGCLKNEISLKHGDARGVGHTKLYKMWSNMKTRCQYPRAPYYKNYGGRGIKIYPLWDDDYISFKSWALEHGYKNGLSIDRIDNDGDYVPDNCQFITFSDNVKKALTGKKKIFTHQCT